MGFKPLAAAEMDNLKDASVVIADAMLDPNRRLHPQALAFLVDSKVGIISATGKVKAESDIANVVQSYITDKNLTGRGKETAEQYYSKVRFTRDEMSESWNNLSSDEKFVWSTFLPDAVLQNVGVPKDEISALRRQGNDVWAEVVEETFSQMRNYSPVDLEAAGISPKLLKEVSSIIDAMKHDRQNSLHEQRERAVRVTTEIAIKLDNAERKEGRPNFLSSIIEGAKERHAEQERAQNLLGHDNEAEKGGYVEKHRPRGKVDPMRRREQGINLRNDDTANKSEVGGWKR
jgi:hypothetical protein